MKAHRLAARGGAGSREPEKIYYKIGEAAKLLELPQYVLRYWETEFPELRPRKTGGGRRIYSRADIELLEKLRHLLHEERYTIEGARKVLSSGAAPAAEAAPRPDGERVVAAVGSLRRELEELRRLLARPAGGRT